MGWPQVRHPRTLNLLPWYKETALTFRQASKDFSDSFAVIAATVNELNASIPIWDSYESALRLSSDTLMDNALRDIRIESICFALEALKHVDRSVLKSGSPTHCV